MGRSRYHITLPNAPRFLTCTVVGLLPLFTRPDTAQILLDSFAFLQRERGRRLYGYEILESQLHGVARSDDLGRDLASFKDHTARQLPHYFKGKAITRIPGGLEFHKKVRKRDRAHQVWEEGSHPQQIQGEAMLRRKLEYSHRNPVKRGYVDDPVQWRY